MHFLANFTSAMLGNKLGSKGQTMRQTAPPWAPSLSADSTEQLFTRCPLAAVLHPKTGVVKFKNF